MTTSIKQRWAQRRNWNIRQLLGARSVIAHGIDDDMPLEIGRRLQKVERELHKIIIDYEKGTKDFNMAHKVKDEA